MKTRRLAGLGLRALLTAAAFILTPASASAAWPDKPIRLIVPYPPGGGTDIVARLLASELTNQLNQNVIVENRAGGNTIIGTQAVAGAAPDGYTIGLITDSHVINPHIMKTLPYDSKNDFEFVSQLTDVPFVMVASNKLGVKTIEELVAKAKSAPGTINFASIGNGSPHYLAMRWFADMAGIDITHIPYTGVAPALTGIASEQVDVMFTGLSSGLPQSKDGRMVALAVSSENRDPSAPEIPSIAESGYPEFSFVTWYGIVAPAGTPSDIVQKLSREIQTAMQTPTIKDRLASLGVVAKASSPEAFAKFVEDAATHYDRIFELVEGELETAEKQKQ